MSPAWSRKEEDRLEQEGALLTAVLQWVLLSLGRTAAHCWCSHHLPCILAAVLVDVEQESQHCDGKEHSKKHSQHIS